jgi:hypothetical protein
MFSLKELLEEVQNNPKPPVDIDAEKERWHQARLKFHSLPNNYIEILKEKGRTLLHSQLNMNFEQYQNSKERVDSIKKRDGKVYNYYFEIDGYECILRYIKNTKKDKTFAHYYMFNEILGTCDIRDLLNIDIKTNESKEEDLF